MKKRIDNMVDMPYNVNEKPFNVVYYQLSNGSCPVKEFIRTIEDKKLYVKVYRNIELLSNLGSKVTAPYSKYIRDGIYELRSWHGNNHIRILYFFHKNRTIVLTNAFYKKTNAVPNDEIMKAKSYRYHYISRKGR